MKTDTISERHYPVNETDDGEAYECCVTCRSVLGLRKPWPCDSELMRRERDEAEAALAEAHALLVPIEWWYCVWCEVKYPYTDDVDVLKTHSAQCEKHPAIQQRDKLAEALREHLHFHGCDKVPSGLAVHQARQYDALDAIKEDTDA